MCGSKVIIKYSNAWWELCQEKKKGNLTNVISFTLSLSVKYIFETNLKILYKIYFGKRSIAVKKPKPMLICL